MLPRVLPRTADEDVVQWRRESTSCDGDVAAAADARAAALEADYSREYLGKLAYVGGFVADLDAVADRTIDPAELAALEEIDETDDPEGDA